MMLKVALCALLAACLSVQAFKISAKLPSYIEQCSKSDPQLKECIIQAANKAIPKIVKGDARYKIPYMAPLRLSELVVRDDETLKFIMRNVEVYGLENTRMTDVNVDFNRQTYEQKLTNPRITIVGDYEMDGVLADTPIFGEGKANITLINGRFVHGFGYNIGRDSYSTLVRDYVNYKSQRTIFNFNNLYGGNEFRGYQTNIFLNNNWQEVTKALQPGASDVMSKTLTSVVQALQSIVPFDQVYKP